jgi:ATP-binding cassette subfamily B protein
MPMRKREAREMSKNTTNKKKAKYGMFSNLALLYKQEFEMYPQMKWLLPTNIIVKIAIPFIGTAIPAISISLITGNKGAGYFAGVIGLVILLYTLTNCLQEYTDLKIDLINSWTRLDDFMKKLIYKSITTDYDNVEPQKQQKLMEKAYIALTYYRSGVGIMYTKAPVAIINLVGMLGYGAAILTLDIKILVILILMSIFNLKLNEYARSYVDKNREEEATLHRTINYLYDKSTTLENAKDIRIYKMDIWFKKVFESTMKKMLLWKIRTEKRWFLPVASDTVFSALRDLAAYIILINQVLDGKITLAGFTLYLGIVAGFSNWLFEFVRAYADLKRGSMQVDDLRYMLEFPDKFKRKDGLPIPPKDQYPLTIEFKDVSFRYEGSDKDTLSHINFTINAGDNLALVGHNGAGKTTLVKLLCGFYHPTSGEIIVGGHPISDYNIDEYYKLIGAVFQDIKPLAFNIAQNVSGKDISETDMDKVRESLRAAGIYDKIESLKDKENTYLTQVFSKDGIQLSGGETQKLMLARAIYKDAPIMILDEPTAALDPIAESYMYEEYNRLTANKTTIFISHRLASTRFCDDIIYLENGTIVEQGTHEELIEKGGKYAEVYDIQSHYYKENNDNEAACLIELNESCAE